MPLATCLEMSATAQLWTVVGGELAPATSNPIMSEMPVPQVGTKCWHHSSDQGVPLLRQEEEMAELDDTLKEHPQ